MIISKIFHTIRTLFKSYRYRCMFKKYGNHSSIDKPLRIFGYDNISIDSEVSIHYNVWLQAIPLTGDQCELIIRRGTTIGDFNHIVATKSIEIQESVLTANFVYISDNLHEFEDIKTPIKQQPIKQLSPVVLGEGCWIGEHVSIIGASVGKHSVIGANSVVTKDIPDYCVAVGAPAYIIKRYNFDTQQWEKTDKQGNFVNEKYS